MRQLQTSKTALRQGCQRGVAAVEFALVVFILLLAVAGIVEFGRTFWYYNALAKATRDGARYLSTVPNDKLADSVQGANDTDCGEGGDATATRLTYCAAFNAKVPDLDPSNIRVRCGSSNPASACSNLSTPTYVQVSIVGYDVTIGGIIPFLLPTGQGSSWTASLSPHTTMRYQP